MITILGDAGYIFNPETQDLQKISSEREAISRIYIAPEDCKVRYFNEEHTAKKGDLIILFYDGTFKHKFWSSGFHTQYVPHLSAAKSTVIYIKLLKFIYYNFKLPL